MIDYCKNEPELVLVYAQKWVRRIQRKDFTLKEFRTYMVHKDIFTTAEKDFIVGYVLKSVPEMTCCCGNFHILGQRVYRVKGV